MDSANGAGNVQYDRWNEDNINLNVEASTAQSTAMSHRIYNTVCNGRYGVAVKVAGALVILVSIYMMGYVTGYYVHRCDGAAQPGKDLGYFR